MFFCVCVCMCVCTCEHVLFFSLAACKNNDWVETVFFRFEISIEPASSFPI